MKNLMLSVVVCYSSLLVIGECTKHAFKRKALSDITELSIDADLSNGQYIARNERVIYKFPIDTSLALNSGSNFHHFPFVFYVPNSYPLYFPTQGSAETIKQSETQADTIDKGILFPTPLTLGNLYSFYQEKHFPLFSLETHVPYQENLSNENTSYEDKTTDIIKSKVENPKPFSLNIQKNPVEVSTSQPESSTKQYLYPFEYVPYPLVVPITQQYPPQSDNYSQNENKDETFRIHVKNLQNIGEDSGSYNVKGEDGKTKVIVNHTTPQPVQSSTTDYNKDRKQLSNQSDQVIDYYQ